MVSIVDNLLFLHRKRFLSLQLLVFRIVKIKITIVTLITSHTNFATLKLDTHSSVQLLAILHVHSWYSDLSVRLWGRWSLNVLTISLVFLWVRGPAHTTNSVCIWKFNPRSHPSTEYIPRNTVAKFYANCSLRLLWKISDQMISHYYPWSATNSARSFTFQPVSFGKWKVVGYSLS